MLITLLGLDGHNALVPWIWTSITLNLIAAATFFHLAAMRNMRMLVGACAAAFVGIWIEKGMGLIIPGFVPSTVDHWSSINPA